MHTFGIRLAKARQIVNKLDFRPDGEGSSERTILQHSVEFILLAQWIERQEIRSYLELGFFAGNLLSALHAMFEFEKVAGCDDGEAAFRRGITPRLPKAARVCAARAASPAYRQFRHGLGKVDLVFIDADHSYGSVREDYERERRQPHRFLAFHDIKNDVHAPGVVRLWNELGGKKRELVHPGSGMGIGIWSGKERP